MSSVSNSVVIERMTTELKSMQSRLSSLVQVTYMLQNNCTEAQYADCMNYLNAIATEGNEIIARWTKYATNYKNYTLEDDEKRAKLEGQLTEQNNTIQSQSKRIEELIAETERLKQQVEQQNNYKTILENQHIINNNIKKINSKSQSSQSVSNSSSSNTSNVVNTVNLDSVTEALDSINKQIASLQNNSDIKKLSDEVHKTLIQLDVNKAFIANHSKAVTEARTKAGKTHMRYNRDVDSDKLIEEYKAAGNQITKEMKRRYEAKGITYHGLRSRLIREGVWNPSPRVKQED